MGILLFIVLYVLYYFMSIRKYDKTGHYKSKNRTSVEKIKKDDFTHLPNEVKVFVVKYNVDLDKINLHGLLKLFGIVLSATISFSFIVSRTIVNDILYEGIITLLLTFAIYFIFLVALGNYFKKKGLVKNGNKKNRK